MTAEWLTDAQEYLDSETAFHEVRDAVYSHAQHSDDPAELIAVAVVCVLMQHNQVTAESMPYAMAVMTGVLRRMVSSANALVIDRSGKPN